MAITPLHFGLPSASARAEAEYQIGQFACSACGGPAITLPVELHDRAPVHCQGCGVLIATWAVFKQRATQVILAQNKEQGTSRAIVAPDPLDMHLVQEARVSF